MKVLVVSDSHGHHDLLRKAIGQEAPIDMLIHAGDVEGDVPVSSADWVSILTYLKNLSIRSLFLIIGASS